MRQWGALGRDCTWPSEEREGEVGGEAARGPRSAGCLGECEAHGSGPGAENAPDQSRAPPQERMGTSWKKGRSGLSRRSSVASDLSDGPGGAWRRG